MMPTVVEAIRKQYGNPDDEKSLPLYWSNSVSTLAVGMISQSNGKYWGTATFVSAMLKSAEPHPRIIVVPKPKS